MINPHRNEDRLDTINPIIGFVQQQPVFQDPGVDRRRSPVLSKASTAAAYILDTITRTTLDVDGAFVEMMQILKRTDSAAYSELASASRTDASFRRRLQKRLVDTLIALSLAKVVDDDQVYFEMCSQFCPRIESDEIMKMIKVIVHVHGVGVSKSRIDAIFIAS